MNLILHIITVTLFIVKNITAAKEQVMVQSKILKCCPLHQVFNVTSKECDDGYFDINLLNILNGKNDINPADFNISMDNLEYDQLTPQDCQGKGRRLLDSDEAEDDFRLLADGRLWLPNSDHYFQALPQEYCVEIFSSETTMKTVRVAVCNIVRIPDTTDDVCGLRLMLFPALLSLSCAALSITILVYILVPDFANLPGRILLCMSVTLLGAMALLLIVQLTESFQMLPGSLCVVVALLLQFLFLSSFTWMTMMSFDICQTFKGLSTNGRHLYRMDSKTLDQRVFTTRFWIYSLFAWGGPFVFSALTMLLDSQFFNIPWILLPRFGESSCWFYGDLEILIYFYGPISALMIVNLAMFFSTISFISLFQKRMRSRSPALRKHSVANTAAMYSQGRERLDLYSRVFVIMGVSWIFEIIVSILCKRNQTSYCLLVVLGR